MKNENFTTSLLVRKPRAEAFRVLLNVREWWSGLHGEVFEGSSEKPGDEFTFFAGGGVHFSKQRMTELVPDKKVSWLVTESNLTFLENPEEWVGSTISFELSEEENKTKIAFTHIGLVPEIECYDSCAPAWTQYIQERLLKALAK